LHFLVVDDDELSRELFALLLDAEGHEVQTAATGAEALALLTGDAGPMPDVILCDMQMPGISGAALASALRKAAAGTTKLLAMSGTQPTEETLLGFDGFLLKPFSMQALDTMLARADDGPEVGATAGQPVGADTAMPALNEEIYAKMAKMMPGEQLGEMYAMCLTDARKRLGQMAKLAEDGDDEGFRKTAHTVKGGCGMIGATELYCLSETAERYGLGFDLDANSGLPYGTSRVTLLLKRFSSACDRLERILGERKQENSVPASGE
jgi:CheY-like chemotaxis protein/HPt (histidine-containing phosphotransfer) domain-containing protein